jgi:hypothetical protein
MTEKGWKALGPVSAAWDQAFGPSWKIAENQRAGTVTGEDARNALNILVRELHKEAARTERDSK